MSNKKVFVIGNGFDISLGWNTRYSDFAKSGQFVSFAEGGQGLVGYLQTKLHTEKWLDIERELFLYVSGKSDCGDAQQIKSDYYAFNKLKMALSEYLLAVQKDSRILQSSPAAKVLKGIIENGKFQDIYTFNYTNLQSVANKLNLGTILFHYVHGALEHKDIILGIDDHENINEQYDFMYKTFDKNYPSSPIQYSLQDADEVVFFGHSLGKTDYHYFQDFFRRQSLPTMNIKDRKKITIFTYDDNSRLEILRQLRKMNGMNGTYSLSLLFSNNEFQVICTDGRDLKDDERMEAFLKHLQDSSIHADRRRLNEAAMMFAH